MKVLITGAKGFLGRNLVVRLKRLAGIELIEYDIEAPSALLDQGLACADWVFHLAGINRPENPEDYIAGNVGFTQQMCDSLYALKRKPGIVFSSSIQAALENPYGRSKRAAEEVLLGFGQQTGAHVSIFRLKNVFGKWCRPDYNSAVATFCHNISHDLPITVSDRAHEVNLVYVDDVGTAMMDVAGLLPSASSNLVPAGGSAYPDIAPSFKVTLGELVDILYLFRNSRSSLRMPAYDDPFIGRLYATYLSYLEHDDFAYDLDIKADDRGCLAEFLKSASFGQIFISRTKPGITRGNHYHDNKVEKFLVVQGKGMVRFRHILGDEPIEYLVSGTEFRVIDIPPGYTHSIENIGEEELITIFWSNEIFDQARPDTFIEDVVRK